MDYIVYKDNYIINTLGEVYSKSRPNQIHPEYGIVRKLNSKPNKDGYIEFYSGNQWVKRERTLLHRLILMLFEPLESYVGYFAVHIDGNKTNNALHNLKWVKQTEYNKTVIYNSNHGKWNKGRKLSNETKLKMSIAKRNIRIIQ